MTMITTAMLAALSAVGESQALRRVQPGGPQLALPRVPRPQKSQKPELCNNEGEFVCRKKNAFKNAIRRRQQELKKLIDSGDCKILKRRNKRRQRVADDVVCKRGIRIPGEKVKSPRLKFEKFDAPPFSNADEEDKWNKDREDRLNQDHRDYDCVPDCKIPLPDLDLDVKKLIPLPYPYPATPPQCDEPPYALDPLNNPLDTIEHDLWGLDRIDEREAEKEQGLPDASVPPLDQNFKRQCKCCGLTPTVAIVIDTGIQPHEEFGSRLLSAESYEFDTDPNNPKQHVGDTQGHGTHVAGTIGGCTVGVNSCTMLVSYRVFAASATSTSVAKICKAIDFATAKALSPDDSLANYAKVINLSVGGPPNILYTNAVTAAHDAGITVVAAAGNSYSADACLYGPANVPKAITVGSTDSNDKVSIFSNDGSCIDVFAPGTDIYSAHENPGAVVFDMAVSTSYATMSGTSMATPHVVGVATLGFAYNLVFTPHAADRFIKCTAIPKVIYLGNTAAGTTKKLLQKRLLHHWWRLCWTLAEPIKDILIPAPH